MRTRNPKGRGPWAARTDMSRGPPLPLLTFAAVTAATAFGIHGIHAGQKLERENLHAGVLRDEKLLAMKERERRALLEEGPPPPPPAQ